MTPVVSVAKGIDTGDVLRSPVGYSPMHCPDLFDGPPLPSVQ
jgi:hypothetical protein